MPQERQLSAGAGILTSHQLPTEATCQHCCAQARPPHFSRLLSALAAWAALAGGGACEVGGVVTGGSYLHHTLQGWAGAGAPWAGSSKCCCTLLADCLACMDGQLGL